MTKIISPIFKDIMLVYMESWQLKYQDEYLDLDVGIFEVLMSLFPFLEQMLDKMLDKLFFLVFADDFI